MPRTSIAVVGNTGDGKSSLLNALLEEEAVLPTSAMRACTAAVVEISRAAGGQPYQAEVEFLSEEVSGRVSLKEQLTSPSHRLGTGSGWRKEGLMQTQVE